MDGAGASRRLVEGGWQASANWCGALKYLNTEEHLVS